MTSMTADEALKSYLAPIQERTEILDANGKLLGIFAPACDLLSDVEKQRYAEISKLFDPEEIARRKKLHAGKPGRTTAQVLEYLRTLELAEQHRAQGNGE